MGLVDQHVHSHHSFDCETEPADNIRQAIAAGLSGISFTEHFDTHPEEWPTCRYDDRACSATIADLRRQFSDTLFIGKGIEVCFQPERMDFILNFLEQHDFDVVLLSIHWAGDKAFHRREHWEGLTVPQASRLYFQTVLEAARMAREAQAEGAAGLLVSKAGVRGSADKAVFGQLSAYPKALGLVSALMVTLSLLPGIPMIPFLIIAGASGFLAWRLSDRGYRYRAASEAEARAHAEATMARPAEEPIGSALHIDVLRLEMGYGLLPLINDQKSQRLTDQIKALRRQLATEMGFVMPAVRIQDNMQLPANKYVIRAKDIEAGSGELIPNQLLAMDPRGEPISLSGQDTFEPTFGLPAKWIPESHREEALFRGLTVVDPATVITTHLTEVVKDHMPELLSYAETQKLLDEMEGEHQKLVADLIPSQVPLGSVQRVLQALLAERVSIRDLPSILEGISEALAYTQNMTLITEHVRARLARQISHANTSPAGYIPLITLSPEWEQGFAESLVGQGEEKQLSMAPSRLQNFITAVRDAFEAEAAQGEVPVLLTSPTIRPYVRSI
ncbi:MAG: FHIPEP family type III secretion protein, partial [Planctomycetes bacterium]|nr:FHIPEP family type III secretion protein [Planctomycetota bacterium]